MAIFKGVELYNALNVSAITSLIDTFLTAPAIFTDTGIAPASFTGDKYILFYLNANVAPGLGYGNYSRVIACRAKTQGESQTIAKTVLDTLNRTAINGGWMNAEMLPTLPPATDIDLFNTPINVIIKAEL